MEQPVKKKSKNAGAIRRAKAKELIKRKEASKIRGQLMRKVRMPSDGKEIKSAESLTLEQKLLVQRNLQRMHGQNTKKRDAPTDNRQPEKKLYKAKGPTLSSVKNLLEAKLSAKREKMKKDKCSKS